jgi:hypothetical protein
MFFAAEAFGKGISKLLPGGKVCGLYLPVVDELPEEVVSDFYVFSAVVKLWVTGNHDG